MGISNLDEKAISIGFSTPSSADGILNAQKYSTKGSKAPIVLSAKVFRILSLLYIPYIVPEQNHRQL